MCLIQTADVIVVAGRFWIRWKPLTYSYGSFFYTKAHYSEPGPNESPSVLAHGGVLIYCSSNAQCKTLRRGQPIIQRVLKA